MEGTPVCWRTIVFDIVSDLTNLNGEFFQSFVSVVVFTLGRELLILHVFRNRVLSTCWNLVI